MIIFHGMNDQRIPRLLAGTLARHLAQAPVVVLTGARQTGKSTLVRDLLPGPPRRYLSLDDLDVLEQAQREPDALLRGDEPITLDEVQRVPEILLAVKRAVDRRRVAGRFLLTGSANLLLMRRVSETLAGRAQYLTLWPFTRRERAQIAPGSGLWAQLLHAAPDHWPGILRAASAPDDWRALARRGGYPEAALEPDDAARAAWFAGYVRTYLERDLQDLSVVSSLVDFRRLMRLAALRMGQLLNQADLARDAGLSPATTHRWLNLLETSYQILLVPGYAVNPSKRAIKSPKLYWTDPGLALHLSGNPAPDGAHLEALILGDVLQWREQELRKPELLFWRTAAGAEVDFVLEHDGRLLATELKTSARVGPGDAGGLKRFLREYGPRTPGALLLYDGPEIRWVADRVLAAPWWSLV